MSVAGVALGVILVAVNTGLVRGMLNDRIRREQGIGAEIQFTRKGSSVISPSTILLMSDTAIACGRLPGFAKRAQ